MKNLNKLMEYCKHIIRIDVNTILNYFRVI